MTPRWFFAHDKWGENAVPQLNGMFAYALWDTATEELLLVRDRLGVKPLYYLETQDGVLFGSEPKAILANSLASKNVGIDGLRRLLGFVADPSNAVFDGMKEVPPGHVVRVSAHGTREVKYWGLDDHEHTHDLDTTVRTVRELLDDTASRQLIADVPLCTLLSGGLDSSALTALAAGRLAAEGTGPVRSFAVDFVGYADNFVADGLRDAPDTKFVQDVAQHVASDHRDIVLSNDDLLDPVHRAAVLAARDYPGLGNMDTSLYLLFKAVREQSTVALSGESADEVFGGYADFHDPNVVAADTFPWLAGSMAQGRDTTSPFSLDLQRQLDMEGYYENQYRRALAEVPRRPGDEGLEARMREISYLYLTRFLPLLLERKDRMSMAVGLEVRVPFCDHRLVQYRVRYTLGVQDLRRPREEPAACRDGGSTAAVGRAACEEPVPEHAGSAVLEDDPAGARRRSGRFQRTDRGAAGPNRRREDPGRSERSARPACCGAGSRHQLLAGRSHHQSVSGSAARQRIRAC